jgi:ComF family protein
VSPLIYEFPVRQLVQQFKFRRNLAAGRALSELFTGHLSNTSTEFPNGLVPVPLHGTRLFSRGFNQAFEIARHLHGKFQIPLVDYNLRRTRRTRAQAGLEADERRKNLQGAFSWHGDELSGRHIALVDDVMTTGATVKACARVLKKAGARRVDIWVLARAVKTP